MHEKVNTRSHLFEEIKIMQKLMFTQQKERTEIVIEINLQWNLTQEQIKEVN